MTRFLLILLASLGLLASAEPVALSTTSGGTVSVTVGLNSSASIGSANGPLTIQGSKRSGDVRAQGNSGGLFVVATYPAKSSGTFQVVAADGMTATLQVSVSATSESPPQEYILTIKSKDDAKEKATAGTDPSSHAVAYLGESPANDPNLMDKLSKNALRRLEKVLDPALVQKDDAQRMAIRALESYVRWREGYANRVWGPWVRQNGYPQVRMPTIGWGTCKPRNEGAAAYNGCGGIAVSAWRAHAWMPSLYREWQSQGWFTGGIGQTTVFGIGRNLWDAQSLDSAVWSTRLAAGDVMSTSVNDPIVMLAIAGRRDQGQMRSTGKISEDIAKQMNRDTAYGKKYFTEFRKKSDLAAEAIINLGSDRKDSERWQLLELERCLHRYLVAALGNLSEDLPGLTLEAVVWEQISAQRKATASMAPSGTTEESLTWPPIDTLATPQDAKHLYTMPFTVFGNGINEQASSDLEDLRLPSYKIAGNCQMLTLICDTYDMAFGEEGEKDVIEIEQSVLGQPGRQYEQAARDFHKWMKTNKKELYAYAIEGIALSATARIRHDQLADLDDRARTLASQIRPQQQQLEKIDFSWDRLLQAMENKMIRIEGLGPDTRVLKPGDNPSEMERKHLVATIWDTFVSAVNTNLHPSAVELHKANGFASSLLRRTCDLDLLLAFRSYGPSDRTEPTEVRALVTRLRSDRLAWYRAGSLCLATIWEQMENLNRGSPAHMRRAWSLQPWKEDGSGSVVQSTQRQMQQTRAYLLQIYPLELDYWMLGACYGRVTILADRDMFYQCIRTHRGCSSAIAGHAVDEQPKAVGQPTNASPSRGHQ